jgi:aldehyde dehydrogenase (NAD+)
VSCLGGLPRVSRHVKLIRLTHSPDYVLTTREMVPKLLDSFRAALAEFNPAPKGSSASSATPLVQNTSYSKIVSSNHFKRLSKLLDETRGEIVIGGQRDEATQKIEVTVVTGIKGDDALMQSELQCTPVVFKALLTLS